MYDMGNVRQGKSEYLKTKEEKGLLEIIYRLGASVCTVCVFVCVVISSSGSQTSSRCDERRWKGIEEGG